jgi:hypothetical protein
MALMHRESKATTIPELDLFDIKKTQTASELKYKVDNRPMSAVSEGSVVEFVTGGDNRDYMSMPESTLAITYKLVHQDGSKLHIQEMGIDGNPDPASDVTENVAPANMSMHTFFNQVDIFFNGTRMTQASNMYGYKAYLKALLFASPDAKKTSLLAQGYFTENGANLDDRSNDNESYKWRQKLFEGSKLVEFEGPLMEDVMQINKYLLNGIRVQIKLYPAPKKFTILAGDGQEYKLELVDIVFRACMIKVSPGVILGHIAAMEKSNATYFYDKHETKSFSVSKDSSNVYIDNMFQGNRPSQFVFGLVASDAFNGSYARNPLKFHHYSVKEVKLVVDGQTIPGRPLTIDFDQVAGSRYIQAYVALFEALGKSKCVDYGGSLTPERYLHGHTLYAYNLEPTLPTDEYTNLKKHANVRLEISFAYPLPETITVVGLAIHKAYFEVDAPRNVILPE